MNEYELSYFALETIKSLISKMYEMRFSVEKSVSYTIYYKIKEGLKNKSIDKDKLEEYLRKYFKNYGYSVEIVSISTSANSPFIAATAYDIGLLVELTINKNITKESELVAIIEKMKKDKDDTEIMLYVS